MGIEKFEKPIKVTQEMLDAGMRVIYASAKAKGWVIPWWDVNVFERAIAAAVQASSRERQAAQRERDQMAAKKAAKADKECEGTGVEIYKSKSKS